MKKFLIAAAILLSTAYGQGKLQTATDTRIITTQETKLVLDNLHFQHNSQVPQINSVLRFTGEMTTQFAGVNKQQVFAIEVDKTNGGELQLEQDVSVDNYIRFLNGKLNLNSAVVQLAPTAKLLNETEVNRAFTTGDGYFAITAPMVSPSLFNAGNLGAFVSSSANLGLVTVKRGHKTQTGSGVSNSISRYYDFTPSNNSGLNATVELLYFDAELNGLDEGTLFMIQSTNSGNSWMPLGFDQKSTTDNFVRKGGLVSLQRYTLSAATGAPLPVSGLEFAAKRLNNQVVQLDWKTLQETNNKGFYIERKRENEPDFTVIHFAPSKGLNGNSNLPMNYMYIDLNAYSAKTWYRIKQEDIDGQFTYSTIRMVAGPGAQQVTVKAWPIPAPKEFSLAVEGIDKDVVLIYDGSGRLIRQASVVNGQVLKISGLKAGTYLLKLKEHKELVRKVIVQ